MGKITKTGIVQIVEVLFASSSLRDLDVIMTFEKP